MLGFLRVSPTSRRFCARTFTSARSGFVRPHAARSLLWTAGVIASVAATATLAAPAVYLDALPAVLLTDTVESKDTTVDSDTSIAFPNKLRINSKVPLPDFTLLGVGVRTVSFLGIRVYSVGFYADITNPNLKIPVDATPEEKIEYVVRNTACVLRIVPTRSTSYSHLRDGFVRALQARILLAKNEGSLTRDDEFTAQSSLRQLKTLFPNTPLAKHTPLEILLTAPEEGSRKLIFRDLGVIQDMWLTTQFVLSYFEGKGISPPLKSMVMKRLE